MKSMPGMRISSLILALLSVLVATATALAGDTEARGPVDFAREVRPILARNCLKCHGPDDAVRESGLRLDRRDDAVQPADSGTAAIVPGRPDESELIRRIFAEDDAERMPPPDSNLSLSDDQKEVLRRWIAEGAEFTEHWAFVPPQPVRPPDVDQSEWVRTVIDRFVLARLEAEGLAPSARADRYALIRRATLDLTGLVPSPDEVDAFVNDPAPDAYERLIDRLLASPHYGERWGRRWLDLARYADTNGYEKDRVRSIWPYRDWVIDALNADLPFDQFTIEQLAGDMLPEATLDQRIATGFHRNTMLNEEGGIDPLEFRFHAMTDRVATTGTAWLGLTIGCAQCHTHKYDPISHHEYYAFMAFLNNADEPELELPDAAADAQYERQLAEADRLLDELKNEMPATDPRFVDWLRERRDESVRWAPLVPTEMSSNLPLLTLEDDATVFVSGDTTKLDVYEVTYKPGPGAITALRLEALPDDRLPAHGPGMTYYEGTKGDFFLGEFVVEADGGSVAIGSASESYGKNRFGSNPVSAALCTDGNVQTGWSVDGRQGERHSAVFVFEEPLQDAGEITVRMTFGRHFASSLGRFRISATDDPRGGTARDLPARVEELLLSPEDELTPGELDELHTAYVLHAPELAERSQQIRELQRRPDLTTTLVMQERPAENPRPTSLHHRGEFLQPKEPVEPGVPECLPPLPADVPADRLGFAQWLVSPENPLTARVAVNRQWAAFFGRGLVATEQDFGIQGENPSHPELLDWLALELIRSEWSMKELHRLIVTSAVYQQSSNVTPELMKRDPENRLLARAPRLRLTAEMIRDSSLAASGLLSEKVGGPSVYPPQPASVTTEGTYGALPWTPSAGEDRYRRSLYTFSKRTTPFAMYATFDGPSGEACVAKRDVSNTPLQALTLLNDEMFVEAARAFGRELASQTGSVEERMTELFRQCMTRPPSEAELEELTAFYARQLARLQQGELDAVAIAGGGDAAESRAAWTVTARVLMNLDEAIHRN